jgi:SRSO17 transposase
LIVDQTEYEAAVSHMVEAAELARVRRGELLDRLAGVFARAEPAAQAGKYIDGLAADLPHKNGWTLAEHAGDASPDKMQRLLNHASWDQRAAMAQVRGFVVEHLGGPDAVLVIDESGQEKSGVATAGVKRQYVGCAGKITNAVNIVYATYASRLGHAIVAARLYLPEEWANDPHRRAAAKLPEQISFKTKPELAIEMLAELACEGSLPPWVSADEVYGQNPTLRGWCETERVGYVLGIARSFAITLGCGTRLRADQAVKLVTAHGWNYRSAGPGSKGERNYAWAWIGTTSPQHSLLIRRSLSDLTDLAFFYCYTPPGRPAPLPVLVRVAGMRWPVEEDFRTGKDHFGLDHSQVRHYQSLMRHLTLAIAALAIYSVTAAATRTRTSTLPPMPAGPTEQPPPDPGLIPLTVAEVKRLFNLLTRTIHQAVHHLYWAWWRRRHQARARWYHHRTRLRRQHNPP